MKKIIPVIIVLSILVLSGCTKPKCPDCQNPGTWSSCSEDGVKTRTNYRCGEETEYKCVSYTEEKNCETQIVLKGGVSDLETTISPTLDETVKGIIKVESVAVPDGTTNIVVLLLKQITNNEGKPDQEIVVREVDASGSDGWKVFIDTTMYIHGEYDWVICFKAENLKTAKIFCDLLLKTYLMYIKEIKLLEVLFPIRVQGILNPDYEKLHEFVI